MTPKHYSSFEEIDKQLNILKLKKAIEKEQLVYNYLKAKYLLYPKNIGLEIGNILQEKLIKLVGFESVFLGVLAIFRFLVPYLRRITYTKNVTYFP
jgi:hypothetical protein